LNSSRCGGYDDAGHLGYSLDGGPRGDSVTSQTKPCAPKVACPECGESFSARGISGHRRFKHPETFAKAKAPGADEEGPCAPLPSEAHITAEASVMQVLARIESRLARLETQLNERPQEQIAPPVDEETMPDPSSLAAEALRSNELNSMDAQTELDEVLLEVAALRTSPEEASEGEYDRLVRHSRLGELRRRQAELMYGLGRDDELQTRSLLEGLLSDSPLPNPE
jgi:hypothetical protein